MCRIEVAMKKCPSLQPEKAEQLRSELVEQSTPSMHQIVDEFASVSNISFTDLDPGSDLNMAF